jgi:hypothetical protein
LFLLYCQDLNRISLGNSYSLKLSSGFYIKLYSKFNFTEKSYKTLILCCKCVHVQHRQPFNDGETHLNWYFLLWYNAWFYFDDIWTHNLTDAEAQNIHIIYTKFHSMTLKLMFGVPQMWGWIWALCFIADTINSQICKADTAHRIGTFTLQCHYSFSIAAIDQAGKVANWCSDCA